MPRPIAVRTLRTAFQGFILSPHLAHHSHQSLFVGPKAALALNGWRMYSDHDNVQFRKAYKAKVFGDNAVDKAELENDNIPLFQEPLPATFSSKRNSVKKLTKDDVFDTPGSGNRPSRDNSAPRKDEEINSTWIQYVSLKGNEGERPLASVLKSFDRKEFVLMEVDANARPPICKLFRKKELHEKAKAAKLAKKKAKEQNVVKDLDLSWSTDPHDMAHKLSKFKGFLEKGYKVEVEIHGKKGKDVTPPERNLVLEKVLAELEPASKYIRKPEWTKATTVVFSLQGIKAEPATEKEA